MASKCDRCGWEIKGHPWLSWHFDATTRTTSNVWITCHPSECEATAVLQKAPNTERLMDHWFNVVKDRGLDRWARDYNVPAEHVARVKTLSRRAGR
jgi:hypothetical protein